MDMNPILVGILDDNDEVRQRVMVKAVEALGTDVRTVCHDNAGDFIEWMKRFYESISPVSLDHDLGPARDIHGERRDPGTGMDVVEAMIGLRPRFPVIVHTSNPMDGPTMVRRLEEGGWRVDRIVPFMENWIPSVWLGKVRNLLSR